MNSLAEFIHGEDLPDGWQKSRLGTLGELYSGATPARSAGARLFGGDIPWVKTGDLNNSHLLTTEETLSKEGFDSCSCRLFPEGSVLIAMYGGFGQIGRTGLLGVKATTNQAISALVCSRDRAHPWYVLHWLNAYRFLWREYAGSSRKDPNISKSDIHAFPVALPPLREQREIAEILGLWDEALEKLDALIATKKHRKQALMQLLLSGQRRLPRYRAKWASVHLKDVAKENTQRNGTKLERTRLYAVTKAEGMVPMRELVQGATIDRCKIVECGWFAYNPMRINIGSIARWEHAAPVMVSPDYVVFHTDESRLLSDYLNHLRRSAHWSSFVGSAGNGSVRVRIWFDDLGHLKLQLPPVAEQRAIADILDSADTELRLLRAQREAMEKQKRGLMQKLLTGKIRVKP